MVALALPSNTSHPVADGNQISLAQFSTSEAKLADSYHLPVYHMPWQSIQEDVFHYLTGLRMFLKTSILPLLKTSAIFLCFSVTGHFIWLLGLLKYAWEWLGNYISHFLWEPEMHPIGSCGLLYVWVPPMILQGWKGINSPSPCLKVQWLEIVGGVPAKEKRGSCSVLAAYCFLLLLLPPPYSAW